jgi:hypothetical protein
VIVIALVTPGWALTPYNDRISETPTFCDGLRRIRDEQDDLGGLGASLNEFEKEAALFDAMFDFAPDPERAKIRGLTARKLFGFVR